MVASTHAQFDGAAPQLYSVPVGNQRATDLKYWNGTNSSENNSVSLQNIASRASFTLR